MRTILIALLTTLAEQIAVCENFVLNGQVYSFQTDGKFCFPDAYPAIKRTAEGLRRAAINSGNEPNLVDLIICVEPYFDENKFVVPAFWVRRFAEKAWSENISDANLQRLAEDQYKKELRTMSREDLNEIMSRITPNIKKETSIDISKMELFLISERPVLTAHFLQYTGFGGNVLNRVLMTVRAVNNELFFLYVSEPIGDYGFSDINYEKLLMQIADTLKSR